MNNQQSQKNAVNNNQSSQQGQKDQKPQQGGFQKDAQKSDTSRSGQTTGSPTRNQ